MDYVLVFLARLLRRLGMVCATYKKRHPEKSDLYKIAFRYFEAYECSYEKRYEPEYGYFRPIIRSTVWKYLDCGIMEHGFARRRCPDCGYDFFVAFSCKTRFFCPSCAQKRTLIWGEWVFGILAEVDHRQWVFTIPKVLRKLFYKDRQLLAGLARCAAATILFQEKIFCHDEGRGAACPRPFKFWPIEYPDPCPIETRASPQDFGLLQKLTDSRHLK